MDFEALALDAKNNRRNVPDKCEFDYLGGKDSVPLRYAIFPLPDGGDAKGTIIFLPGRTEFIEKFYEDIYIFQGLGYACAGMDLRGQGMSHRELEDRDRHYVKSFDNHVGDVKALLTRLEHEGMPKPFILMGHSAGSHVILRALHHFDDKIEKAITVSPMVGINRNGLPAFLFNNLPSFMVKVGLGKWYVPGHTAFKEGRWGWRRKLTHDDERFEDEDHFIKTLDRRLAVGGATYRWIVEAQKSCATLLSPGYPESIRTPILLLQAGEEQVVDNDATDALAARLPNVKKVRIEGAMHEMLKETDRVRGEVWRAILKFLDIE